MAYIEKSHTTVTGSMDTCILILLLSAVFILIKTCITQDKVPLINRKRLFDFGGSQVRRTYASRLAELLEEAIAKSDVCRMQTPNGIQYILAPKFADEVARHPDLIPGAFVATNLNASIPGLEVFQQLAKHHIVQDTVRLKLTRNLQKLTATLSSEAAIIIKERWTDNPDWHEIRLGEAIIPLISGISSKVFVGDELAHNSEWRGLVEKYSSEVLKAGQYLNLWPRPLRRLVAHFNPSHRKLRHYVRNANRLLLPVIEKRRATKGTVMAERVDDDDAIQWLQEMAGEQDYDPTMLQLTLALGSIHTTGDLLMQVLLDLCSRPNCENLIQELRAEIGAAFGDKGCQKLALHDLKLLDSVLKESQRLKPGGPVSLGRQASKNIELSNGTKIPKGSLLLVANSAMRDPEKHKNPEIFDPYRYFNLRSADDRSAYFVSNSPQHQGFGLGRYACPGRFFAAHELKIILCHILTKYDLRLNDKSETAPQSDGLVLASNQFATISIRRRQEDVVL